MGSIKRDGKKERQMIRNKGRASKRRLYVVNTAREILM
jgi:hypothetical protein